MDLKQAICLHGMLVKFRYYVKEFMHFRNMKFTAATGIALFALLFSGACKKAEIEGLQSQIALKDDQIQQLEKQVNDLQATTGSLLDRMSDLSVVNKAGAESIKQSLESISQQYGFIQDLTSKIHSKDSLNLALVMNLKQSLTDIDNEDVQIEIREGVVYVSISDKLLFRSGSATVSPGAEDILGRIAEVINTNKDLDVVVEGHTDNVPMAGECIADNWDLSVKRATSVVRSLTDKHRVSPERLTASGRSEYFPKADNSTVDGRSTNRRTEIIIAPRLDQFFKMLEKPPLLN